MPLELNVLALFKNPERYILVYDDASLPELLNKVRDLAADPRTTVNWFDAAVLADRAREQCKQVPPRRL